MVCSIIKSIFFKYLDDLPKKNKKPLVVSQDIFLRELKAFVEIRSDTNLGHNEQKHTRQDIPP